MKRYLRGLKPTTFEDIIAMVALYRPGPMQFIDSFIRRKHGEEEITYLHSGMKNSLKNTYGILVYQEQFMQISKEWCGFTGGQADTLRKAVGKKKIDLMKKVKPECVEGAVKVGGATETEIDEKKFRVDDAVAATKAALAEGIVAGGGVTLVNLAGNLKVSGADSLSVGRQILKDALKQPFLPIMKNAGLNADALLAQVESGKPGFGVNVMKPEDGLIDVKKAGVIDPARVTKEAVQNAVSIASTAATMGALVVDIPEAEVAAAPGGMPGMGMM